MNKATEKAGAARTFFFFRADYINILTEGRDNNDPVTTYQDKISNDTQSQWFKSKELHF